jgi:release factor glutamine methyltransferase
VSQLARAGFPAAREEVRAMVEASPDDPATWQCWADRRVGGEPLEWLIGFTVFMGHRVRVDRGVYVPRPQSELIARRAVDALPARGAAADLCTGSGAIAVALRHARPGARVVATDIDAAACRCAESNGVETYQGHLAERVPEELVGRLDVVVAVVPYVPTDELVYLPRDVRDHEPLLALDGGARGIELLDQVIGAGARLLRTGGVLVVELGGRQDEHLLPSLEAAGFQDVDRLVDGDGDLRGLHARLGPTGPDHDHVGGAGHR